MFGFPVNRLQSYEKSSAKQKNLFFFLPRQSNFAVEDGKVTKKRAKHKRKDNFSFCFRVKVTSAKPKLRKKTDFFCRSRFFVLPLHRFLTISPQQLTYDSNKKLLRKHRRTRRTLCDAPFSDGRQRIEQHHRARLFASGRQPDDGARQESHEPLERHLLGCA